jgi:cob(I)alamin adenosyltransferase
MASPVTTKHGDTGTTLILGGQRLPKSHPILQTTGKVDSLRAQTALLRLQLIEQGNEQQRELVEPLFWLLHCYFLIGTAVNDPACAHPEYRQADLEASHLARLEEIQRELESKITLPKSFIVSASNTLSAQADVTATVARDLERALVQLKEEVPAFDVATILAFVNRLSDSLYIMARFLEQGEHVPVDYGVLE